MSLKEFLADTSGAVMFAADLATVTGVRSVGEASNAVGVGVAPETKGTLFDRAGLSGLLLLTNTTSAIMLTADLAAITGVGGWESSDTVGVGVAPEA